MKHSFEGIGQWSATFACGSGVAEGKVVKISANGTGGVKADTNGRACLVADVDTTGKLVTFVL